MRTNPTRQLIDIRIYPKCNIKKEHQKQSLNLVCVTKSCKYYGPICVLCKKQHLSHHIIPIKNFIASVIGTHKQTTQQKNKMTQKIELEVENSKSNEQKLQAWFHQVMGVLNYQVKQLSQQIMRVQKKIIEEFEQVKAEFDEQNSKKKSLMEQIDRLRTQDFNDSIEFRKNINSVLKVVAVNKNEFSLSFKEEQIVENYHKKVQLYKNNIFLIQAQIKELYSALNDDLMGEKIQKLREITRPKTAVVGLKDENITFSFLLKSPNIKLQKENKIACLDNLSSNKLVILQNGIGSKINELTFRIQSLYGETAVGVGLKTKIKQKLFSFSKNPGHGLYMITANGSRLNHSEKTEDGPTNTFSFASGSEISVCLKPKERRLLFLVSNNDKKKTVELSLKSLPESSFKDLQFCAALGLPGDKIEII